jgi:G:T-mismatch repair DNA endonuclease (very short patch repair protein)
MIGNVSKKEQALTLALKTFGFAAGKIKGWYCDAVNYDTKVVVELHGDWWHVKPGTRHERIIRENYDGIHPLSKISIEQIWERDAKKQCVLEALGYTYIVVWESDLDEWLSWIQDSLK